MLTYQRAFLVFVLACLCAHVTTCLACLRTHVPTCFACLRAHVPVCLSAYALTCQRALRAYVLMCKRAILNNVNSFIVYTKKYLHSDWLRGVQCWSYMYSVFNICTLLLNKKKNAPLELPSGKIKTYSLKTN